MLIINQMVYVDWRFIIKKKVLWTIKLSYEVENWLDIKKKSPMDYKMGLLDNKKKSYGL